MGNRLAFGGVGDDRYMTPEQAAQYYEEDEDPKKIFALFDAGEKGVTTAPADIAAFRAASISAVVGLWRELRQKRLPKVSTAGPRSYVSGRA